MICVIGRLITQMFEIGPYDFWCYSTGEHHFGFFIGWGLLGFIIGFFIICCSWWCIIYLFVVMMMGTIVNKFYPKLL